jgi:uncharacterized membrane protein YcaP (DUF421 family)
MARAFDEPGPREPLKGGVMSALFPQSMAWWEFALRGIGCYLGLLILLRLSGKRTFGEMSPFDIVVLILVGGALRSAMVGKDDSFLGPFIAVAAIIAIDKLFAVLATLSPRFNRTFEGRASLLVKDGKILRGALARHSIPAAAFERELRLHEARSVEEIDEAHLEANGRFTVLKSNRR